MINGIQSLLKDSQIYDKNVAKLRERDAEIQKRIEQTTKEKTNSLGFTYLNNKGELPLKEPQDEVVLELRRKILASS